MSHNTTEKCISLCNHISYFHPLLALPVTWSATSERSGSARWGNLFTYFSCTSPADSICLFKACLQSTVWFFLKWGKKCVFTQQNSRALLKQLPFQVLNHHRKLTHSSYAQMCLGLKRSNIKKQFVQFPFSPSPF